MMTLFSRFIAHFRAQVYLYCAVLFTLANVVLVARWPNQWNPNVAIAILLSEVLLLVNVGAWLVRDFMDVREYAAHIAAELDLRDTFEASNGRHVKPTIIELSDSTLRSLGQLLDQGASPSPCIIAGKSVRSEPTFSEMLNDVEPPPNSNLEAELSDLDD